MANQYDLDFPELPWPKQKKKRGRVTKKQKTNAFSGSAATMNDLPDELILEILEYLPAMDEEDFQLLTLASLSLVNRRWHRIVADKLFHSYSSSYCEPYLFLRTLSCNPQRAELVQHATMLYGGHNDMPDNRHVPSAQDKKIVKEGMRALNIPGWKEWASKCNTKDVEIEELHSAILMHTRNLNSLLIWSPSSGGFRDPGWLDFIKQASNSAPNRIPHRFEHLRSVGLEAHYQNVKDLAPIFQLPSIRTLLIRHLENFKTEDANFTSELQRLFPPRSSMLEDLEFRSSWINMDDLSILFASLQNLKRFRLELDQDDGMLSFVWDEPDRWGTARLSEILRTQKDSLEKLWFNCNDVAERANFSAMDLRGSLKDFSALKSLHCPLPLVVGGRSADERSDFFRELPPTLVSLQSAMRGAGDVGHVKHFEGTLEATGAPLPSNISCLKEVVFSAPLYEECFEYDWADLVKLFSAVNIKFVVVQDENEAFRRKGLRKTDSSVSSDEVSLYSNEG